MGKTQVDMTTLLQQLPKQLRREAAAGVARDLAAMRYEVEDLADSMLQEISSATTRDFVALLTKATRTAAEREVLNTLLQRVLQRLDRKKKRKR
jgi:hypothetical protein